ncbi:MAG: hypothetical protein L3J08_03370, partial [Flavobacteriaceae bacterium]|nr:hypothetical protein [Flavobacteriaceae bacterium]
PDDNEIPTSITDTQKDCKKPICQGGSPTQGPDDSDLPDQNAPDDCKKETCKSGDIISEDDPTETAPLDDYAEENYCAIRPSDCLEARGLSADAVQWAKDKAAQGYWSASSLSNGIGDAARHAYWNCLMASDISPEFAEGFTNAHEEDTGWCPIQALCEWGYDNPRTVNPCDEKIMDLSNNEAGRGFASQSGSCEANTLGNLNNLNIIP